MTDHTLGSLLVFVQEAFEVVRVLAECEEIASLLFAFAAWIYKQFIFLGFINPRKCIRFLRYAESFFSIQMVFGGDVARRITQHLIIKTQKRQDIAQAE